MKVLVVDVNCETSSTGEIAKSLVACLKDEGHEAVLCYGRGSVSREPGVYKFGIDWETRIHAGLTRLTGYTGCFSPFSTKKLLMFMEAFKPDVVHLHELHAYFVNIAPIVEYLKRNKIKTIWTFHCEFMYTGKCGYAYECERWKVGCGKCPHLHDYVSTLFFDKTHQQWEKKRKLFEGWTDLHIVTPSQWLADRVLMSFLTQADISVIHNGIDTNTFYPRDTSGLKQLFGIKEAKKIVLSVGSNLMTERKGGRFVLELAAAMPEYLFILVGADEQPGLQIPNNVLMLGVIEDKATLAKYYSLADIFVICSSRETFSLVCAESLCCGTPVVGFKNGAAEEISIPEHSSFVEYADIGELLKVLKANSKEKVRCKVSDDACRKYNYTASWHKYKVIYEN